MTNGSADELEALVRARAEAVERHDTDALMAQLDDSVLTFGVLPPTATRGSSATREAMETWFGFYSEGPHYAPQVIESAVEGDLGYVAYLYHVTGTTVGGDEMSMWVRTTLVCRRGDDDRWKVVHAHEGVPMDPESGQALISEPPPPV